MEGNILSSSNRGVNIKAPSDDNNDYCSSDDMFVIKEMSWKT